jgi:predicted amidohydrolase YtcJ
MLIRNAEVDGECLDVRLLPKAQGGVIAEIGKALGGKVAIDARGGALLPGLHDHHIHLNAAAAAMNSVKCGPPYVNTEAELIAALGAHSGTGFLRGVGYHHSTAGEIDRAWLDRHGPDRPIRIQHRSGRLWIFNSEGLRALGLDTEKNDGRLLDQDEDIRSRFKASRKFPDLKPFIRKLLSWGVTGVTEVTPSNGHEEFRHYLSAARPLRLSIMGGQALSKMGEGDKALGPLKLHYHEYDLPSLEFLSAEIKKAHRAGRNVAAHCVTRAELMLTLAAIEDAGAVYGDRIEHAAIADTAAIAWMKALNLIVVTQPNFIKERIEAYLKDVPTNEHENLWRLRAFSQAGLSMAAGSDAPFGAPNPWAAMAAATARPHGFEQETITPEQALSLYTKPVHDAGAPPRVIAVGAAADLCLIDQSWEKARQDLGNANVIATWIAGACEYQAAGNGA